MNQTTNDKIRQFTENRDWDQFYTSANLARSIYIIFISQ